MARGTTSSTPSIILDCDPGHDDAVAIVVAAAHTDLLGITTVAGNAPLADTTRNALVVTDLLGIDPPVHAGAARPLVAPPQHAPSIHGTGGLAGAALPPPSRATASDDAVGFIIDTCRAVEGVWIVAVGPLTNVALALRSAPDLARRLGGISVMGGGTVGNRTPVAEFNIWADPEAASVVFGYGGPLLMCGLDVTYGLQATPERIAKVRATGTRLGALLADLLAYFSASYSTLYEGMDGAAVHDPCAVLALTHPELFSRRRSHVEIETSGVLTRGMTVIDRRALRDRGAPNCDEMTAIDADAAFAVIVGAVAAAPT